MSKIKLVLLTLFLIGLLGALNSITNQSINLQERGLVNGVLRLFGLIYIPGPPNPRILDYVPSKVTSEVSRLAPERSQSTPAAQTGSTNPSSSPQATPVSRTKLPTPTPIPTPTPKSIYDFSFSNSPPVHP